MACHDKFGNMSDGRPFWTGDFNGNGRADVLFYYPGDGNWWLGSHAGLGGELQWSYAGNTSGFGDLTDGRPIWIGNFSRNDRAEVLFYYPGDGNWWLGSHNGNELEWSYAGNTDGFGQVWDGRPFWTGNISHDRDEILFYYPGDGNWWLGSHPGPGEKLQWSYAGNTGRPYNALVRIHLKILAEPTNFTVDEAVRGMQDVYSSVDILGEVGSTEDLDIQDADIEVGACTVGQTTQEQRDLFGNRNNVGADDIAVYLVRTVTSNGNALNGCAAHDGRPSCVVARAATRWTMAHEVGHVLDLNHVNDNDRLMTGNGTANITNPPPDLVEDERQTMEHSRLTQNC